jgi:hypothetical protein
MDRRALALRCRRELVCVPGRTLQQCQRSLGQRYTGFVSQRYAELIDEWRAASAQTRAAQAELKAMFEAHLEGKGPPPAQRLIERLRELRDLEHAKLDAAMAYVRRTASGPPTGHGSL